MKIKQKKQLNLPQLIEWIEKNGIRNHVFISDIDRNEVEINIHGCIFCKHITLNDTFTVEDEEEITEITEFELLLEVRNGGTVIPYYNESIQSQVDKIVKEYHAYIDGEFELIWTHEKGMVE